MIRTKILVLIPLAGVFFCKTDAFGESRIVATHSHSLLELDATTGRGTRISGPGMVVLDYIFDMAFDTNNNRLYAVDSEAGDLIAINPETGIAARIGHIGFGGVSGLAFDPNTNRLYGSSQGTNELMIIDTTTGAGEPVGQIGFASVYGLAFDRNSNTLYGAAGNTGLIVVDPETGSGTDVSNEGSVGFGLAYDSNTDTLFGATGSVGGIEGEPPSELRRIDPVTGVWATVSPFTLNGQVVGTPPYVSAVAFDDNKGKLFCTDADVSDPALYTVDPTTATGTRIGFLGPSALAGLAHDRTTNTLYGTTLSFRNLAQLVAIDPLAGKMTSIGLPGVQIVLGLEFDSNTELLYGAEFPTSQFVTIDPATGLGNHLGPLGFGSVLSLALDLHRSILYGASRDTGQLLTIDSATGLGTVVGPIGFDGVSGMAFDRGSRTLYAFDGATGHLLQVDAKTGKGTTVGSVGFGLLDLTYDSTNSTLLGISGDSRHSVIVSIDSETARGTSVGELGFGDVEGLAYDPYSATLFGVHRFYEDHGGANGRLIRLDPSQGTGTSVAVIGRSIDSLTFDPITNTMLGANRFENELVRIDPLGEVVDVVAITGFEYITALAWDSHTGVLYGADSSEVGLGPYQLIRIDPHTGAGTVIGELGPDMIASMAFDPESGMLYGISRGGNLFSYYRNAKLVGIDTESGVATPIGDTRFFDVSGLAVVAELCVDLVELEELAPCVTGPAVSKADETCRRFDYDRDGSVDLNDVRRFQVAFKNTCGR